jgi:dihydroorotase
MRACALRLALCGLLLAATARAQEAERPAPVPAHIPAPYIPPPEEPVDTDVLYDIVLQNGRVLDPESGMDQVMSLGIKDGRIALLSSQPLTGREVVDVTGLAVAPGFIDIHAHGQNPLSYDYLARDGVTSALDLELGAHGVKAFLREREGESRINFGVSAGHLPARVKVVHGISIGHPLSRGGWFSRMLSGIWQPTGYAFEPIDSKGIRTLVRILGEEMDAGGIGIGMGLAYTPGATPDEVRAVFALAADRSVPVFLHMAEQQSPDDLSPLDTALEHARATGASLHVVHIASSMRAATPRALATIDAARTDGLLVTTEVYPYTAGSTAIESALFQPGWRERTGLDYGDLQWAATGERLDEKSFAKYRKKGGIVIIHGMREEWVEDALRHPLVLVASDAMPIYAGEGGVHPRSAGTHARVLGVYVRERGVLTLLDAVGRMSFLPARRLEFAAPAFLKKGRIKLGADADLVVFDPATVIDRATYEDSPRASEGIPYVMVGGKFVVRGGALVTGAFPGQALRSRPRPGPVSAGPAAPAAAKRSR